MNIIKRRRQEEKAKLKECQQGALRFRLKIWTSSDVYFIVIYLRHTHDELTEVKGNPDPETQD